MLWQPSRLPSCFSWVLLYWQYLRDICTLTPEVLTAAVPVVEMQERPFSAIVALTDSQHPKRIESIKTGSSLLSPL